ncbi:hypothetical protein A2856_03860 [Candidatus Uhrbacteria bacterium RIFCSPHIGHO2_01_FULL_63_20]|uniref:Ligand-binding protein SH3 n=1 Tax=Candidatus Uhrbacteria bacterium RIFCSPHIGHO2_01_FULL_63_20 TaxID=1802385 RepID=A0A1F7TMH2_9BACT|nr:MAG: hypothetical protein A2856_03860 [Candidatus Uhrbacteria bacterium RIFCSPHIGHO2_01_FULL_63_20]
MPSWLQVMFIAALPVVELRGALPIALTVHGMPLPAAIALSVAGNMLPVPFILRFLPPFVAWTERHVKPFHRLMERYFRSLRLKHEEKYQRAGALALFAVGALPFPGAGAWTASVLAVLFSIRPTYAVPAILAGILWEAFVVWAITTGAIALF